jgi:hypothetical protein
MCPSRRTWGTAAASAVAVLAVLGLVRVGSPAAAHPGHTIVVTTIQAAVDAAQPGDTILVSPGTYRESVLVTKSHLRIVGSRAPILDAAGFRVGIRVGTGQISRGGPSPACPPLAVKGFTLEGLTIRHAGFSGVSLIGVDGYRGTEADFAGTHTGEFLGMAATGRSVRVPYCVVYDLRATRSLVCAPTSPWSCSPNSSSELYRRFGPLSGNRVFAFGPQDSHYWAQLREGPAWRT